MLKQLKIITVADNVHTRLIFTNQRMTVISELLAELHNVSMAAIGAEYILLNIHRIHRSHQYLRH